ncbi:hypothetical protein F5Y08DRAFT_339945 [Xylaria arbuscula]|nr:hypothetical protein F5Y08DRAFT_339945 [Xylaria arbuscula]
MSLPTPPRGTTPPNGIDFPDRLELFVASACEATHGGRLVGACVLLGRPAIQMAHVAQAAQRARQDQDDIEFHNFEYSEEDEEDEGQPQESQGTQRTWAFTMEDDPGLPTQDRADLLSVNAALHWAFNYFRNAGEVNQQVDYATGRQVLIHSSSLYAVTWLAESLEQNGRLHQNGTSVSNGDLIEEISHLATNLKTRGATIDYDIIDPSNNTRAERICADQLSRLRHGSDMEDTRGQQSHNN